MITSPKWLQGTPADFYDVWKKAAGHSNKLHLQGRLLLSPQRDRPPRLTFLLITHIMCLLLHWWKAVLMRCHGVLFQISIFVQTIHSDNVFIFSTLCGFNSVRVLSATITWELLVTQQSFAQAAAAHRSHLIARNWFVFTIYTVSGFVRQDQQPRFTRLRWNIMEQCKAPINNTSSCLGSELHNFVIASYINMT